MKYVVNSYVVILFTQKYHDQIFILANHSSKLFDYHSHHLRRGDLAVLVLIDHTCRQAGWMTDGQNLPSGGDVVQLRRLIVGGAENAIGLE